MSSTGTKSKPVPPELVEREVARLLEGRAEITIEQVKAASPIPIPPGPEAQAVAFITPLFQEWEYMSLVQRNEYFKFTTRQAGVFQRFFSSNTLPICHGGMFVRINPVAKIASGRRGAHKDSDVTRFDVALLEIDDLPINRQLAILTMLPLPILSMVHSGRRSVHCLIRVDAANLEDYKRITRHIMRRLRLLGFDPSNVNPSRMTRLPGATRGLPGSSAHVQQELIYLNPRPEAAPILG
jgi:hypothetical protein